MSAVVKDAIAEELELLEQLVATPVEPFGFGSDLSCGADLNEAMAEVDPFSTLAVGEALLRRLDTPRGALPDDPDYGLDLRGMLNKGVTADDLRALAGAIRSELQKDDRVDSASVRVVPAPDGSSARVELAITPVDPQVGGFDLTFAVTDAGLVMEALRP